MEQPISTEQAQPERIAALEAALAEARGAAQRLEAELAEARRKLKVYEQHPTPPAEAAAPEVATAENQARVLDLLSGMPVLLDAFDKAHRLVLWNEECERVTGYSRAELLGRDDVFALLYPDPGYREQFTSEWHRRGKNFRNWELTLTRKDGEQRVVAWSNVSDLLPVPGWAYWAVGIDVTEQRRAEAALYESEQRLRLAFEVARFGTWDLDLARGEITLSEECAALVGLGARNVTTHLEPVIAVLHPDDKPVILATLERVVTVGGPVHLKTRVVLPDRSVRWLQAIGQVVATLGGAPRRMVGVLFDITEQHLGQEAIEQMNAALEERVRERTGELELANRALRYEIEDREQAEHALRDSQRFLERVMAAFPAQLYVFDYRQERLIYNNKGLPALLGYAPEAQLAFGEYPVYWLMHPADRARLPELYERYDQMSDDDVVENEFRARLPDGGWSWLATRDIVFSRDADGRPQQMLGAGLDITARKAAETERAVAFSQLDALNRELSRSDGLLRTIINSLDDGLALIDADGTILMLNQAMPDLCGLDVLDLLGRNWHEVSPFDAPLLTQALGQSLAFRGREYLVRDGLEKVFDLRAIPLASVGGGGQMVLHLVDVTERLQFETLALKNERFAATGRLAAVVAHEVNSPLQAIQNFLFLAASDDPAERKSHLKLVAEEIDRIASLIRRLLDLQRPGDDTMRVLEANSLIEKVLALTSSTLTRHRVLVTQHLSDVPLLLNGRADQLTQVLLNLVLNALDTMPHGGELQIRSRRRPHTGLDGLAVPATADVIVIEVADTGHGIPPALIQRIFEPLFTTKSSGSGLGLAISRQIVEHHGGRLTARNRALLGAVFSVVLPAWHEE